MKKVIILLGVALVSNFAIAQTASTKTRSRISKEQAIQTALAKVPNGTLKEAELEKEHGKLVWSFDIATPDSKDIIEVQVDANSGAVVSVEKEAAKAEIAEKKKDQKHK